MNNKIYDEIFESMFPDNEKENEFYMKSVNGAYDYCAEGGFIDMNIKDFLIPDNIINGVFDEVNINKPSDFEINNKLVLEDVVNKIEKILKGD